MTKQPLYAARPVRPSRHRHHNTCPHPTGGLQAIDAPQGWQKSSTGQNNSTKFIAGLLDG